MATFNIAYLRTYVYERGYVNDPIDPGGETYNGISRKNFPNWAGWKIVDTLKKAPNFPKSLEVDVSLQDAKKQFYKVNFWDKIQGDKISDQYLANELYDCAVNMGVDRATTFLQQALNVLNRNASLYPDITVDGDFGPGTLKAFNVYLKVDKADLLLKVLWILRGSFYVQIMQKTSSQEKYARGWLSRVIVK